MPASGARRLGIPRWFLPRHSTGLKLAGAVQQREKQAKKTPPANRCKSQRYHRAPEDASVADGKADSTQDTHPIRSHPSSHTPAGYNPDREQWQTGAGAAVAQGQASKPAGRQAGLTAKETALCSWQVAPLTTIARQAWLPHALLPAC
ncbi:hypothetical protein CMUS01_12529 [Colletotrichum musicola]|uniref:Uncharacterized protein n=1 Tax=Colletotrichum musicola TaxID=2175873 RepID=A0A8H6JKX0_9PEZI|nr:hypothetical protein CMUS01_12529 [Colletotrichum musicola]